MASSCLRGSTGQPCSEVPLRMYDVLKLCFMAAADTMRLDLCPGHGMCLKQHHAGGLLCPDESLHVQCLACMHISSTSGSKLQAWAMLYSWVAAGAPAVGLSAALPEYYQAA